MALSLSRLSWWLWGGKEKESTPRGSSVNSLPDCGPGQPESLEPQQGRKKWVSGEERRRRVDKEEYDMVLVRSDDVYLSGSESDESDWSIGWLEPHNPDFCDDNEEEEEDNSFAVLVPCYRYDRRGLGHDPSNHFFRATKTMANDCSLEGKKHMMEQWLLPSHENF